MIWIQTHSGKTFRLDERPDPRDVQIDDIAHALSHLCRFNGHTREFYSVAQHSVLVSEMSVTFNQATSGLSEREAGLLGLLHDAHEAYVGVVTRPLKQVIGHAYEVAERRAQEAVCQALGLVWTSAAKELIGRMDLMALATEARDLLPGGPVGWKTELPVAFKQPIRPMPSHVAKAHFLARFEYLMGIA